MPYRPIQFRAGHYYHIYNRGVNRQPIFFKDENWIYFLRRLRHYCPKERIDILAYCLLPNHYHLLVHLRTDDLSNSIMQPFALSYTKSINKQQSRTGPLFEGPFEAKHVDRDDYLRHLTRYIHLNPVAAGLVKRPEDWIFSSYREYIGLRNGTLPAPDAVLAQFPSRNAYRSYVEAFQTGDDNLIRHLLFDD